MVTDFRLKVSPLVIASDASNHGLGVCYTTNQTSIGNAKAKTLQSGREDELPIKIGLIEVFAGVGGVRAALYRIGPPITHVSIEHDSEASKVIGHAWPEAMHFAKAEEFGTEETMQILRRSPHTDLWLIGGGFPCQPHSSHSSGLLPIPWGPLVPPSLILADTAEQLRPRICRGCDPPLASLYCERLPRTPPL